MDKSNLILKCTTESGDIHRVLQVINAMAAGYKERQGYTVLRGQKALDFYMGNPKHYTPQYDQDGKVIPLPRSLINSIKNIGLVIGKKNGVDNYDSVATVSWDKPKTSPDGKWQYISSLSSGDEYKDWKQTYDAISSVSFIEEEKQSSWSIAPDEV